MISGVSTALKVLGLELLLQVHRDEILRSTFCPDVAGKLLLVRIRLAGALPGRKPW